MKKTFLLLLLFFITFSSCEEDLINSSIPEKEDTSINTKTNSSELIKFEKLESDLKSYKSFKLAKKSSNSNVLYRKIVNTENNTVTYTLPLAIYTTETPYYLIQQIIKNDNDVVVQHLKIIPDSKPTNPNTDILGVLTGRIELLDENLQFISSTKYQDGKAVKKDPSIQSKTAETCYIFSDVVEVKCTNGGNHGVGQSCSSGYTNNAYYITTFYTMCYGGNDWFSQGGGYNSGSVDGGYIFDYQLNSILTNPTFKYADYIVDPSHSLLLQAIRQWIPNNISDLNGDLSALNDRVKIFVDNEQMFYDLETYNQNTNNPRLPNMEVADYSVRVYEMFKFLLSYPTLENGLAARYSVAYLDKNRMISWEDFFMTFKGIGKIMINNPEISKEQLLNWMSWYDKYKQTRPNVKTYFNQNPQDLPILFSLGTDFFTQNPNISWDYLENWFFKKQLETESHPVINPDLITFDTPIQQASLPSFNTFLSNFPKNGTYPNYTELLTSDAYKLAGGSLWDSHLNQREAYNNACAIRGSRGLLYSGFDIPVLRYNGTQRTQKGGDGKNYILDAVSFNKFMIQKFGDTPHKLEGSDANDPKKVADLLKNKNGIYVIINDKYPSQIHYSGHVDTIINGKCIGGAYTTPNGGVKSIRIWVLN